MTWESQTPPPFPASYCVRDPCWEQEAHRALSVPQMKGLKSDTRGGDRGDRSPLTLPGATKGDSEELKPSSGSRPQTNGNVPSQGVGFKKCTRQGCLYARRGPHTLQGVGAGAEVGTAAQKSSLARRFKSCKKSLYPLTL